MPRVRFLKRFDWNVPGTNRRQTVVYLPGMRELVTTPCATEAVATGAAEYVEKFNRGSPALDKPPDEAQPDTTPVDASPGNVVKGEAKSTGRGK